MPVQAHNFDDFITTSAGSKKTWSHLIQIASPNFSGDNKQKHNAYRDMDAMETRDHEETCAKLGGAKRVTPGAYTLRYKLGPLKRLHADERRAKQSRE